MRPHQKLDAWGKPVNLVVEVYKATERFSKEEKYGLTSQIRRAGVSFPANIAEGAGRYFQKEFAHFLSNTQGSASELESEFIIAHRLGYLSEALFSQLMSDLETHWPITGLTRRIRAN
ncbi:MAG: four helix bundle protein [Pyrinomonadaceae bacterium]|jgi:four helix bundle protein|nr:four helix bundle protein [Pyrinomonadaceae bacterium]